MVDISKVNEETLALISRITGRDFRAQDVTPLILYLAALITISLGVIFADTTVSYREEQRLERMLDALLSGDVALRDLAQTMVGGIDWHHVYVNSEDWATLAAPLSTSERLLLLALGYEMSIADHDIDPSEQTYLKQVAARLDILPSHVDALEQGFSRRGRAPHAALAEVRQLLEPSQFCNLDPAFEQVAIDLLHQMD